MKGGEEEEEKKKQGSATDRYDQIKWQWDKWIRSRERLQHPSETFLCHVWIIKVSNQRRYLLMCAVVVPWARNMTNVPDYFVNHVVSHKAESKYFCTCRWPNSWATVAAGHIDSLDNYWKCERGGRKVVILTISLAPAAVSYPFFFLPLLSFSYVLPCSFTPEVPTDILPSHLPMIPSFFPHIPWNTFFSILTVLQKRPEGRRETDKRTEIVRKGEREALKVNVKRVEKDGKERKRDGKREIMCVGYIVCLCMDRGVRAQTSSWQICPILFICGSWFLSRRRHFSPPSNLRGILSICCLSHLPSRPAIGCAPDNIKLHSTIIRPLIFNSCWNKTDVLDKMWWRYSDYKWKQVQC